jgi:hypothetical protein
MTRRILGRGVARLSASLPFGCSTGTAPSIDEALPANERQRCPEPQHRSDGWSDIWREHAIA